MVDDTVTVTVSVSFSFFVEYVDTHRKLNATEQTRNWHYPLCSTLSYKKYSFSPEITAHYFLYCPLFCHKNWRSHNFGSYELLEDFFNVFSCWSAKALLFRHTDQNIPSFPVYPVMAANGLERGDFAVPQNTKSCKKF